jgi:type VI protein secretion system component Hcp
MTLVLNPGAAAQQIIPVTGVVFGISAPTPVGGPSTGAGAGKLALSPISFSKARDQYSTELLDDSLNGRSISTAALEAFSGRNASSPFMTWSLSGVKISSYSLGDSAADRADAGQLTYSGLASPTFDSDAAPAGSTEAPAGELRLTTASDGKAGAAIPIYEDNWGEAVSTATGPNTITPLTVRTGVDGNAASLFHALVSGTRYPTVTITLHDPGASAATVYTLTNATVTEMTTSSGPSLLNSLSFNFEKIDVQVPDQNGKVTDSCWDLTAQAPCSTSTTGTGGWNITTQTTG